MIRSLRLRFIRIVMESFLAVLLLILVGVNLVNRYNVYAGIDARLAYMAQSDMGPPAGMVAATPEEIRQWVEQNREGFMSESSYFIFSGYMAGPILWHQLDLLSAATGEDGSALIARLLEDTRDRGDIGSYRYYTASRTVPYKIVFLHCDREFDSMRSLFQTSVLVGAVSFLLVLLLVSLLSKQAIRPFAENIENQKRFISNASHELKTPLGVIMSDLDLQILESGETEWLQNAQLQADHLARLIEQLTTYSLLDENKQRAPAVPVDLSALTAQAAEQFRPLALARAQTVTADIRPGVTALGSIDAFQTLLSILLDHAVKYAPAGGHIELSLRPEKKAILEITNDCDDLDDIDLDHIFERFYRSPGHRASQDGHGLGLSIAAEIAGLYGGTLRAAARDGRSVTFTAEL